MLSDNIEEEPPVESDKVQNEIRRYLSLLWHWTWFVILMGGVLAISAFIFSSKMASVYETSAKVLVIASPVNQQTAYNFNLNSQNLVPTYVDMLKNDSILREVNRRLKLTQTPVSLAKMIDISPIANTSTIKITVKGTDHDQIALIANTLVTVFVEKISTLQSERYTSTQENLKKELLSIENLLETALADEATTTDPAVKSQIDTKILQYRTMYATVLTNYEQARLAEIQATSAVVQIDPAGSSYELVSPKTFLNTIIAGLLGALLAAGIIFVRDALDNTIRSADDIRNDLKLPVLGIIYKQTSKNGLISITEPHSPISEAYRSLRTNLYYVNIDNPFRSILVTSPTSVEDKSTVSINLAIALAQIDNKVTLIDVDLQHPMIHELMNHSNTRGLKTLLARSLISFRDVLQSDSIYGLSVITTGEVEISDSSEILASPKMALAIEMLQKDNNVIVLDAPPVLPVADARILAPLVDGVLLVVQSGQTTLKDARQAVESLHQVKARIIGVVLKNGIVEPSHYSYYYGTGPAADQKIDNEKVDPSKLN